VGIIALIVLLGLPGCQSSSSPSRCPPTESTASAPPVASEQRPPAMSPTCRAEVGALAAWLQSIEDAGLPLALSLLDEGSSLVEREGPTVDEPAPLVHLEDDKRHLDGIPMGDVDALRDALTELIELRRKMMPESPFIKSPRCHLAVDADVPWTRVHATVLALRDAGVERVSFLFSDPGRTLPDPPVSRIDAELDRMKRSAPVRRGQIIAELMAYVYQDCPEGLRVIANMGLNPVADFKQAILDALPEAIGKCGCAPDETSVKALHWALFGNPRPVSRIEIAIAAAEVPAASELALPAARPWSSAHEAIAELAANPERQPVALAVQAEEDAKSKP
jgi:hypothetical protein